VYAASPLFSGRLRKLTCQTRVGFIRLLGERLLTG